MILHNLYDITGKEEIFMGIDQSMTHTGFTIVKKDLSGQGKHEILFSRGISTKPDASLEVRMFYIKKELEEAIDKYKPEVICLESLAFRNAASNNGKVLAGLYFVIINLLFEKGLNYFVINIKTLKKVITGNGNASKEEMEKALHEEVKMKLSEVSGVKYSTKKFEDIVDSYWLALFKILE